MVKFLGKGICYIIMKEILSKLWNLKAGFDLMDLGNDYFIVKIYIDEYIRKVMEEGPSMIFII